MSLVVNAYHRELAKQLDAGGPRLPIVVSPGEPEVSSRRAILYGCAVPYGVAAEVEGGTELVRPGAFAKFLAGRPDVRLTVEHVASRELAGTADRSLILWSGVGGLMFRASFSLGSREARRVYGAVLADRVRGCSVSWDAVALAANPRRGTTTTITSAAILEVSLALDRNPAYSGTWCLEGARGRSRVGGGE